MGMFKSWRRRYWLRRRGLAVEAWCRALATVPIARGLAAAEEERLRDLVTVFLYEKTIHRAGIFELTKLGFSP
jgi:Mlc titration factor MtfA (ptsG expression regulator)